ncbi:hypothetical protein SH2C18_37760 [Clostridium sediminicola]|uniref:EAL domain-containing protein n=1 Tax=Clostridium sediminicola TaxID=3114879 RepID=UPI0031F23E43
MGKNSMKSKNIKNYLTSSKKDSEEKIKLETALEDSEKKFKQFSDNIGAGMFIKNSKGERIFVNNYLKNLLKYEEETFFEVNHYDNKMPMSNNCNFSTLDKEVLQNKIVSYENKIYDDKKKEVRVLWTTKFPINSNEHGMLIGGTCLDVTEIKNSEKKLKDLCYRHQDSELYNLKFLEMKIEEFLKEEGNQYGVVYIVIKNIDEIYEISGQARLNKILRILDTIIKKHVSKKDVNILLNDHEFLLGIFNYSSIESIVEICNKIEDAFSNPIYIDDTELSIVLSMGIAVYPEQGRSCDSLIQKLRISMKSGYMSNKNIFLYNPDIESTIRLKKDLNKAIENNEMVLYYQPIIDANSEKIIKVEALLRWIHPEKKFISPGIFIPLAEESNQIINLGMWVIEQGAMQLKSWNDKGIDGITMSINISPKQFQQKSFVKNVKKIINDTGVNPNNLEFEITESVAINDLNLTLAIINELGKMGIKWAMDDFGTGYSSLTKLKDLKLDTLKIDRAFVSEINENVDTALMVSAIIAMAKNLQMNIVAEGVENLKQFEFLKNKNCDMLQGFLISKPCEAKEIEKLFFKEFSFHKRCIDYSEQKNIGKTPIYNDTKEIMVKNDAYKMMFYNAPLAFIKWNKDMIIQEWNKHAEIVFGWTETEAVGKNILELLAHKSSEEEILNFVHKTLSGTNINSINNNITKNNGIVRCQWYSECIYDVNGTLAFIISIIKNLDI